MPQFKTADGFLIKEGDRLFNYYDGWWGTVGSIDEQGWFELEDDPLVGPLRRAVLNGERVCAYIPRGNPFFGTIDPACS